MNNCYGANNYGQLGINRICEQCNEPESVSQTETLQFENIVSIKGGGGHTLILDKSGRVYGCGLNSSDQLACASNKIPTFEHIKCLDIHKVSQVECGWDCSFAVTEDECVVAWGSNVYGQLGIPKDKITRTKEPVKLALSGVTQISCGLRHTAILLSNGKIMVAGQGRKGQLGLTKDGHPVTQTECFEEVSGVDDVKMIACGQNHTVALTSDGKLLAWGDNKHGQLGHDPVQHPHASSPLIVQVGYDISTVLAVFAGWTHTVLLTGDGCIVNNGRNSYGQLGSLCETKSWIPQRVDLHKRITQVAVGSEHNFILSDDGELWSWGWNEHGSCGLGNDVNVFQPTQIKLLSKAILIGTGSAHCFVLTKD